MQSMPLEMKVSVNISQSTPFDAASLGKAGRNDVGWINLRSSLESNTGR